jgi:hypothetical protein
MRCKDAKWEMNQEGCWKFLEGELRVKDRADRFLLMETVESGKQIV